MDPFTIAAAIGAGGSLLKGLTALFAGETQQKLAQNAAHQHLEESGVQAQEALISGDQVAAHGAVAAAANGGGLTGSSLGVISSLSQSAMFNARAAAYRGRTQAQADIYQGQVARAQGVQSLVGGLIGAGSSIAGGFMQSAASSSMASSLAKLRGAGADSAYDYAVPF